MKKFSTIFLILFLIISTALVKNSTKRIEEEIFLKKENIRDFKKDFENIKLEHEYLSSPEKLLELHDLYFENKLFKKEIQEIKIMNLKLNKLEEEEINLASEK